MPIPKKYLAELKEGNFYHIYNRSIGNRLLFREEKNYYYFLQLFKDYFSSSINLYAYCLIPNHFHLFIQVGNEESVSNQFRSFFIAYANAINQEYNERGGLFQTPFRRIHVDNDLYFTQVIYYIHYNAVHHKMCTDVNAYRWSSYKSHLSSSPTLLHREAVLEWFGGRDMFIKYHTMQRLQLNSDIYIE